MSKKSVFVLTTICLLGHVLPVFGQGNDVNCTGDGWLQKSDADFAADCASFAFDGSLLDRQRLAWMLFTRVNRLIDDPDGDGMSRSGKVPIWMAWPTDPDTFDTNQPFDFQAAPRNELESSTEKKDIESGRIATADPDGSNEEVTRNKISYDYLIQSGLTTKDDVAAFFAGNEYVDMPVGSVELKASWLQVTNDSPAPTNALTFQFDSGEYWWRGLHIMVKMQSLDEPKGAFYTEEPSWFWTTFEFNGSPGVAHVRETFITQRASLPEDQISSILEAGDLKDFGFEAYASNGTQIRFTENGNGATPVILGHTDMEDFAGSPNSAQARYWKQFETSCHSCHATAAYNPKTKEFFPFSVPTGALEPGYNASNRGGEVRYLGQGYRSLDFMWPIAFQAD